MIEALIRESDRAVVYGAWHGDEVIALKVRRQPSLEAQHRAVADGDDDFVVFERFDDGGHRVTAMRHLRCHSILDEVHARTAIDVARVHHALDGLLTALAEREHPALRTEQIVMVDESAHLPDAERASAIETPLVLGFDAPFPRDVMPVIDAYVAPEQLAQPSVTAASNVYAFGAIAYELLTATLPFASPQAAVECKGVPPSIHRLRPGLDGSVEELIRRCLALDPATRPTVDAIRMHAGFAVLRRANRPYATIRVPRAKPGFRTGDDKEAALVDALRANPADRETRQVYADWLEEHGFDLRAQQLRIEDTAESTDEPSALPDHVAKPDAPWRAIISRTPIAKCTAVSFAFRCPKRWDALEPTSFDDVRHCTGCEKPVFFVTSVEEAYLRGARNECIAIDRSLSTQTALSQWQRGAIPPPPVMGMVAPLPGEPFPRPTANPPAPRPPEPPGLVSRMLGWFRKKDNEGL